MVQNKNYLIFTTLILTLALVLLLSPRGLDAATIHIVDDDGMGVAGDCDDATPAFTSVAVAAASASAGDTIFVCPGFHTESSQIVIDIDLTVEGYDRTLTTLSVDFDTGSGGDSRGFILVTPGTDLQLRDLTIDGSGRKVWQAIRHRGSGSIERVDFREIKFDESGPSYAGTAVAAFGSDGPVHILESTFEEIGRIGGLYFGSGVNGSRFEDNVYIGKGVGDWLDYALDISAGVEMEVVGNEVSGNRGVASSDGSTSGAFLVTTFFGSGTTATILNNDLSDNTTAIIVGYNASDSSLVNAHQNNISGNDFGVTTTAPPVDATCNWWGIDSGPGGAGPGTGDTADSGVAFYPWLVNPAPSTCPPVVPSFEKDEALSIASGFAGHPDKKIAKAAEKAVEAIEDSLDPSLWIDGAHLEPKGGNKVFDEEKKAAKELEKIIKEGEAGAQAAIDHLLQADEALVLVLLDEVNCTSAPDAKAEEKCLDEVEKALEDMTDAAEAVTEGKPDKAIDRYKKAWKHGLKATEHSGVVFSESESAGLTSPSFSELLYLPALHR